MLYFSQFTCWLLHRMEETLLLLIFIIANDFNMKNKNRKKRPKRFWVRKWLTMRHKKNAYFNTLSELQNNDAEHYRNYLRMNHEMFQVIIIPFTTHFPHVSKIHFCETNGI